MGTEVQVELGVRVPSAHVAGRMDRERGLAHAWHALDDPYQRDARGLVNGGEQAEFVRSADEVAGIGRQGVRLRCVPRLQVDRRDSEFGVAVQDALVECGEFWAGFGALLDEAA